MSNIVVTVAGNKCHLCLSCEKEIPTCDGRDFIYGDAEGNDNIVSCSGFQSTAIKLEKELYDLKQTIGEAIQ